MTEREIIREGERERDQKRVREIQPSENAIAWGGGIR